MNTSRYIQINDYLLLEYFYEGYERDSTETENWRLNNKVTDTYQFLNDNASKTVTGNVLDWSASIYDKSINKWAFHDIDNPNLINSEYYELEEITAVPFVKYDTVKVHILSGFTFEDLDGLIIDIKFKEVSGKDFSACTHVYLKSESSQINFSETPLLISERNYDKYLEIQIPSLFFIQDEFWPIASLPISQQDNTFAYNFSHPVAGNPNPGGYQKDSLIYVSVHEISSIIIEDDVTYLKTNRDFNVSFNNADTYALLAAVISESDKGQYFEYYATWGGEFVDDYINNLNATTSGDWGIINQIEIYEQVGISSQMTSNRTELQNDYFDTANILRPVILNADTAYSFLIDYTMRLYNKLSGEQIVRKSSLTSFEPKKYGKELLQINIDEGFKPMKIYNKIDEIVVTKTVEVERPPIYNTVHVQTFIQNYNISININSKFGKDLNSTIFGQGKATLFLNNFDNVLRFKILKQSKDGKEDLPLNLTNANVVLVFMLNDDTKSRITSDVVKEVLPENGEFQFSIDSKLSTSLLKSKNNDFFIVSKDDDIDKETLIYQGKYFDFKDYDLIMNPPKPVEAVPEPVAKVEVIEPKVVAPKVVEPVVLKPVNVEPIVGKTPTIIPDVVIQTSDAETILKNDFLKPIEKRVLIEKSKVDIKRVSFYKAIKPKIFDKTRRIESDRYDSRRSEDNPTRQL